MIFPLALFQPVHAALISIDYLNPGDNLITLDTNSGLEWLDLTVTQGMSTDAVQSSAYITREGFQYALLSDVTTLFNNAGITLFSRGGPISSGQINEINSLITLTGATTVKSNGLLTSEGMLNPFITPSGPLSGEWAFKAELNVLNSSMYYASVAKGEPLSQSAVAAQIGSYLVRPSPVPVPAAVWLFTSGLIGLAGLARRRKA